MKCECWPYPVCTLSKRTATSADMANNIVKRAERRGVEGVLLVWVLKCSAWGSWCVDA